MDFVQDQLSDGKKIRVLTVVDTFTRFSPAIDVCFSHKEPVTSANPVDGRRRRYGVAPFAQGGMDLVAVHVALAASDDLGLDAFGLTPLRR